jgi:hypothetical protein
VFCCFCRLEPWFVSSRGVEDNRIVELWENGMDW